MRFAYAGIDMLGTAFDTLVAAGWTPVKLFTRPCDGIVDFNDRVVATAARFRTPIQLSRLMPQDFEGLAREGVECLVVAGYPWLVTGWKGVLPYALNIHPSPLPEGRGPYPLMRALLEDRRSWGVTAHVLAPAFDTGAIIAQENFDLDVNETHDSLLTRCQLAAGTLARRLSQDLPQAWENATPQGEGSYWPRTTDAERTLDWSKGVEHVLRTVRAFGSLETIARFGDSQVFVQAASGWRQAHDHAPGALVLAYQRHLTIAASDGYVTLTGWSTMSRQQTRAMGR
ncbi:MAG: formyl transferase [Salinarimonadaceae bacterium]|nr:MAG: formyl transferase [Salinarimonadaceae bacterium]